MSSAPRPAGCCCSIDWCTGPESVGLYLDAGGRGVQVKEMKRRPACPPPTPRSARDTGGAPPSQAGVPFPGYLARTGFNQPESGVPRSRSCPNSAWLISRAASRGPPRSKGGLTGQFSSSLVSAVPSARSSIWRSRRPSRPCSVSHSVSCPSGSGRRRQAWSLPKSLPNAGPCRCAAASRRSWRASRAWRPRCPARQGPTSGPARSPPGRRRPLSRRTRR